MVRQTVSTREYRSCSTLLSQYDPRLLDTFKEEMAYGVERFFLLSFCLACCWPSSFSKQPDLRMVRYWNELEFAFPNDLEMQDALDRRYFVPGNSVPIDVDVQHREGAPSRIFVTIPRFDEGRPITLGTVDEIGRIKAYPNYTWHDNQGQNCGGFTSVFRVAIDKCNRLWVVDTGKIGDYQYCDPQVTAFDLNTDTVVFRHVLEKRSYSQNSLLITPVIDIQSRGENDCSDTFVYIADVSGFAIVVIDVANSRSWRASHRLFFPYPDKGSFTIDGESFDLMDGVLGMALNPVVSDQERYLYFHALASNTENVMRTAVLRNQSLIQNSNLDPSDVYMFPKRRSSQSAASAIDRSGIMYFGLMEPPSIWCWNTATEFGPENFHKVAMDKETLQFASGVKIINNLKGEEELWVLTSSFQRVMTGSLSIMRINYRIHAEKIPAILANNKCRDAPKSYYHDQIPARQYSKVSNRYGVTSYL